MKVLSIRQPWASLIIKGFKDVENRSWKTSIRGKIAIHASSTKSGDDLFLANLAITKIRNSLFYDARKWLTDTIGEFDKLPRGVILGTVEITDCKRERTSPWHFEDNWGFYLKDPKEFENPIPSKGKLGFWDFEIK